MGVGWSDGLSVPSSLAICSRDSYRFDEGGEDGFFDRLPFISWYLSRFAKSMTSPYLVRILTGILDLIFSFSLFAYILPSLTSDFTEPMASSRAPVRNKVPRGMM